MAAVLALYSLLSNYELGVIRLFPFPVHRAFDFLWGILVVGGCFYFATGLVAASVFAVVGLAEMMMAVCTREPDSTRIPTMT